MTHRSAIKAFRALSLSIVITAIASACALDGVVRYEDGGVWITLTDGVTPDDGVAAVAAVFRYPEFPEHRHDGAVLSVGEWIWVFGGTPSEIDLRCAYSVDFRYGNSGGTSYCVGTDTESGELVVLDVLAWMT